MNHVEHCFEPVFDENSKILILGTMPSPASRKYGFYYSHPQNRFWKLMSTIFDEELPFTPEEKRSLVLRHNIALWDVLQSCDIEGASDSSIKNETPNDIKALMDKTNIEVICTTGAKAEKLYMKHIYKATQLKPVALPSTSPANAAASFEHLARCYAKALN